MKNLFVLLFCAISLQVVGQERTYKSEAVPDLYNTENKQKILIVTFNNKMYRSDVDKELGSHNSMNQQQIQTFFQRAVPANIMQEFEKQYHVISLDKTDDDTSAALLSFIYESLKYEYEALNKGQNKNDRISKEESGLIDGQVVIRTNDTEKFMNAYIINDTLMSYLMSIYNFDYLILVNEFDMTYSVSDPQMAAYGGIQKKLRTHYTIFTNKGKMIESGAQDGYLENEEKDVYKIAQKALPQLANKIMVSFSEVVEKEKN